MPYGTGNPLVNSSRRRSTYLLSAGVGALVGGILGYTGAVKADYEFPVGDRDALLLEYSLIGMIAGAIAGALHRRFATIRERGRVCYYAAWAMSWGISVAIVTLPDTVSGHLWVQYTFIIILGMLGGIAFGWFAQRIQGRKW